VAAAPARLVLEAPAQRIRETPDRAELSRVARGAMLQAPAATPRVRAASVAAQPVPVGAVVALGARAQAWGAAGWAAAQG